MDKLLLVEDDIALGAALEFSLIDEGYSVIKAQSFNEALDTFKNGIFDIILLDVNLPDGNGYDLCKKIREISSIPIIFLTALDEEVNIVMGLELGANDYITKPFGIRELIARIKVQLRANSSKSDKLISDNITADLSKMSIYKNNLIIPLTDLEYKLLVLFLQNPFCTLKREEILEFITGDDGLYFDENTLSVYIKRLREKIEDDIKNPKFIVTKRGIGYQWNFEVKKQ